MKTAIKYGLILAAITILITSLKYFFARSTLITPSGLDFIFSLILPFVLMYLALRAIKRTNDGFLSVGEGLMNSMLVYAIGTLLGVLFTFCLLNYIDPSIIDEMPDFANTSEESFRAGYLLSGGDPMTVDQAYETHMLKGGSAISSFANPSSAMFFMFGWFVSLFFPGLVFAFIISFIQKNETGQI